MGPLLPREKECLSWIAKGKTSEEVAMIMGIKLSTTRSYLKNVRVKLNCTSMAQCVYKALQQGFIS
jgi:DNA-binding CsgD family transcriptional regulator